MDRDKLILSYLPYVKVLANTVCYFHGVYDKSLREDCQSVAKEALILAIDDYDPIYEAALKTWVNVRVSAAIKEYFRTTFGSKDQPEDDVGWARRNLIRLNRTYPPNAQLSDIENRLDISMNGIEKATCRKDLVSKILALVDKQGKQIKKGEVLRQYYMEGYKMTEIAQMRGGSITSGNISQIISKAKTLIRNSKYKQEYLQGGN
ncbi:MAG: sigma-70 family RNA polymerase sigma factor [Gammaproteobacteria bacterium]|nr:sigma-70 family RNA polymerase sigma factor [Gammaproteobacteria bacterium]